MHESSKRPVPQVGTNGRSLNVCLVSEEYPPETGWGGIGTYAYNMASGLAELGHRVHVIARGWGQDTFREAGGVRIYRLSIPEPSWRWGTSPLSRSLYETRQILLWNHRVNRVVQRIGAAERLDVIEVPEYHAQGLGLALSQRRIPMVVKLHTPSFLCRNLNGVAAGGSRLDTFISEHLEFRLAQQAGLITSPSRKLAEAVSQRWGFDARAIRVIPNPIDDELFCPRQDVTPDHKTVLYVGRLERRKGVETLVKTLPLILPTFPETCLRLVGKDHRSGPGGSWMCGCLRQWLRGAGVPERTVEFVGPVDRAALPEAYGRAAVCVVPSLYENFPYTCLEAMACGSAVVASAVGGIPEIITDGVDGVLVPPEAPEALAAAILRLLADPALRHRLGARARTTIGARFNREAICAQTVQAYRSLLV